MTSSRHAVIALAALSAHALAAAALSAVSTQPMAGGEVCFNDDSGLRLVQLKAREFEADKRNSTSKVVFIKTHYTGSTTFTGILQRYCDQHNATCARRSFDQSFDTNTLRREDLKNYVKSYPKKDRVDIWPWHVEYDRQAFQQLIPGAFTVSFFREPIARLISGWSHAGGHVETALRKLHQWKTNKTLSSSKCGPTMHSQVPKLSDLDMVMLTEDYDRSLVLAARKLGWPLQDLLYTRDRCSKMGECKEMEIDEVKAYLTQPLENMTETGKTYMKDCVQPEKELYNRAKNMFESQLAALSHEERVEVKKDVARLQSGLQVLEDCCAKNPSDEYCDYLQEKPSAWHTRTQEGRPPQPGSEHAHCRLMALSALKK